MALFSRGALASFFGLAEDDDYEYNDYPPEEYDEPQQPLVDQTEHTNYSRNNNYEAEGYRRTFAPRSAVSNSQSAQSTYSSKDSTKNDESKVVHMHAGGNRRTTERAAKPSRKITIVEPRIYSEAMTIAKRVIEGEAVLVNFHLIEEMQARRIVDFLTGTVYALDGDIQRVGDEIFLCTPDNVEIDSSTAQTLAAANFFDL